MVFLSTILLVAVPHLKLQVLWEKSLFELGIRREPLVAVSLQGSVCVGEKRGSALAFLDGDGTLVAKIPWQSKGPFRIAALTALSQTDGFAISDALTRSVGLWDGAGRLQEAKQMPVFSPAFSISGQGNHYYFEEAEKEEGRFAGLYQSSNDGEPKLLWSHLDPDFKKGTLPADIHLTLAAFGPNSFALVTPKNRVLVRSLKKQGKGFDLMPLESWSKGKWRVGRAGPDPSKKRRKEWLIQNTIAHIELDGGDYLWVFGFPIEGTTIRPYACYDPEGTMVSQGRVQDLPLAVTANAFYFLHRLNNEPILQKVQYKRVYF